MNLRTRLHRLEERLGPPSDTPLLPTTEELVTRLEWWLGEQTYNRGVLDGDPHFRPAWSRYHRLWDIHTGGYSPLHAVWLPREPADFEEARQAVLPIMGRVLQQQPRPTTFLDRVLAALAANAKLPGRVAALGIYAKKPFIAC
jgi:hypothetical protein